MLRASTEEDLIELVFAYRQRNDLPIGDIEKEIERYYCNRWPNACHEDARDLDPDLPYSPPREPLLNRVARWASITYRNQPRGGYALATSAEAADRAKACVGCPRNQSWRGGCAGCSTATSQLLLQLRNLRKTSADGNLLACTITGSDNQCSVHLPAEATPISAEQREAMPDRCWRKKLIP